MSELTVQKTEAGHRCGKEAVVHQFWDTMSHNPMREHQFLGKDTDKFLNKANKYCMIAILRVTKARPDRIVRVGTPYKNGQVVDVDVYLSDAAACFFGSCCNPMFAAPVPTLETDFTNMTPAVLTSFKPAVFISPTATKRIGLTVDEIEAFIWHEVGHVANGDIDIPDQVRHMSMDDYLSQFRTDTDRVRNSNQTAEYHADRCAVDRGLGKALLSGLNRIKQYAGRFEATEELEAVRVSNIHTWMGYNRKHSSGFKFY